MKRRVSLLLGTSAMIAVVAFPGSVSAHNRGLVWLPTGQCVQVGSLKSVSPGPDKLSMLDLRPETPQDEFGAAYAADEGKSAVEKGQCP